jgi:hypothetical protein
METMTSIVDRFLSLKSQKTLDKTIDESLCSDNGCFQSPTNVSEAIGHIPMLYNK